MTSGGRLAIGGRSAQQNDQVFSRHMDEADLFFHADIQGGMALILKDGIRASEQELHECAQFAASMSNAWKNANAAVDTYSVGKGQLSKHSHGGYIPAGAFAITGEKKWFRSTKLGLRVGMDAERGLPAVVPDVSKRKLQSEKSLFPSKSGKEKGELAKTLSKAYGVHPDELLEILPSGRTKISDK
jgi:hypothetical protein